MFKKIKGRIFILVSVFILTVSNCCCNLVIHPSLADYFVESFRDDIYISASDVINKQLAIPYCSSADGMDCHHLKKIKEEHILGIETEYEMRKKTNAYTDNYKSKSKYNNKKTYNTDINKQWLIVSQRKAINDAKKKKTRRKRIKEANENEKQYTL